MPQVGTKLVARNMYDSEGDSNLGCVTRSFSFPLRSQRTGATLTETSPVSEPRLRSGLLHYGGEPARRIELPTLGWRAPCPNHRAGSIVSLLGADGSARRR